MADMAKLAYRPVGLAVSLGSAAIAGRVVGLIWKKLSDEDEIPDALDAQYTVGKVLAAALIQAGVFAIVQVLVNRGGAKVFERLTGSWPGN
ncbi:DUF4235 domain-containing protein [Microlunatus aurantiacus]|uniref:DUF4235 domain-containing protein n=2 Tax=Microlunatus aurantiacus TaxID=446786 RepID=A0ABP7CJ55_9ACTN